MGFEDGRIRMILWIGAVNNGRESSMRNRYLP